MGYSLWGRKESDTAEQLSTLAQILESETPARRLPASQHPVGARQGPVVLGQGPECRGPKQLF